MANKHYQINEEFDLTLNVKVKLKSISNFYRLDEVQIAGIIADIKNEMKSHLEHKLYNEYYNEDVVEQVDYVNFEIVNVYTDEDGKM